MSEMVVESIGSVGAEESLDLTMDPASCDEGVREYGMLILWYIGVLNDTDQWNDG
jgi:hypothetical protein